ncbi:MAG TPA: tetratricopeptide repeat protein [Longimicrobiaceae bacterium]|nr:tetratricopeptide repeat protein [Longimicrobiaceae bacterium]
MKIDRGLLIAAAVAAGLSAFSADGAAAQRGRGSLPETTCQNARASDHARRAVDAYNRSLIARGPAKLPFLQDALENASQGITADAGNPYHHLIRGQSLMGLAALHGQPAGAEYTQFVPGAGATIDATLALREGLAALKKAVELCPEFAAEETDQRATAAAATFQLGLDRYTANDTLGAISLWEAVSALDSTNVTAVFNLGVLHSQRGDAVAATAAYRKVLAMTTAGDSASADQRAAASNALLTGGARLFNEDKFVEAAEAFAYLHTIDPANRDAWYNHALALYKLERWQELVPVGARLVQLDPLNYNAQIILFNAYKGLSDAAKARNDAATETSNRALALSVLERAEALPVQVDGVQTDGSTGSVKITGKVGGGSATAGSPVRIEFTLVGASGDVGSSVVTIAAPAKETTADFEVSIPVTAPATSWRYRLAP